MATVFALSAWKGSGKDMIADYLVQNHGFQRISFADPLKDRVAEQYGLDRASLDDQAQKELPLLHMPAVFTDDFSRHVGTFMFREFRTAHGRIPDKCHITADGRMYAVTNDILTNDELYWTRRALCILEGSSKRTSDKDHWVKQAVEKMLPGGKYVLADVRYQSELNALFTAAPNSVIAARIDRFESSASSDPSERDLDNYPFPFRINNKGVTKEEVFAQVEAILTSKGVISGKDTAEVQGQEAEG